MRSSLISGFVRENRGCVSNELRPRESLCFPCCHRRCWEVEPKFCEFQSCKVPYILHFMIKRLTAPCVWIYLIVLVRLSQSRTASNITVTIVRSIAE